MDDKRFLRALPIGIGLALVLAVSSFSLVKVKPPGPGPELSLYARVPDFTLMERSGKSVGLSNLKGEPWIADFIFTRCAGICPMMTSKMSALSQALPEAQLVSFSVDPAHDTPQVLAEYAGRYGADPERWLFLTGSPDSLNSITTALHMNKIDEPMMHSASFVLVDGAGAVRGYYDSADAAAMEKLKSDWKYLAR